MTASFTLVFYRRYNIAYKIELYLDVGEHRSEQSDCSQKFNCEVLVHLLFVDFVACENETSVSHILFFFFLKSR